MERRRSTGGPTPKLLHLAADTMFEVGDFLPLRELYSLIATCHGLDAQFSDARYWQRRRRGANFCSDHTADAVVERYNTESGVNDNFAARHVSPRTAFGMLHYAFSTCRAKPHSVPLREPLLDGNVPVREGADMCTLADGKSVYLRGGFCDDPLAWVFCHAKNSLNAWVPEAILQRNFHLRSELTQHEMIVYGHRLSLLTDDDDVVQYGGCTMGGYRGMVPELHVSCASPTGSARLAHVEPDARCMPTSRNPPPLQLRTVTYDLYAPQFLPRAYHAQCCDSAKQRLFIFGGLLESGRVDNHLLVINVAQLMRTVARERLLIHQGFALDRDLARRTRENTWPEFVEGPATVLASIRPRFGHSMVCVRDTLYIAGGYTGSGMFALQDGIDLTDIHAYDLTSGTVRVISPRTNSISGFLGRCHTAVAFGPFIAYYGGTARYSARLVLFDTRDSTIRKHDQGIEYSSSAQHPNRNHLVPRVAHAAALSGSLLVICGGCHADRSVQSEVVVDLCPAPGCSTCKVSVNDVSAYRGDEAPEPEGTADDLDSDTDESSDNDGDDGADGVAPVNDDPDGIYD
jgi:hypothetical protein